MLCCISRKAVQAPKLKQHSLIPLANYSITSSYSSTITSSQSNEYKIHLSPSVDNKKLEEELEDEPTTLSPCAICARTFKPQSLEKHTKICERAAINKRRPFDSAKQRIRGTELEEFLPSQVKKLNYYEEKINPKSSWKQTHDEFLRAIRAAREDSMDVTPNRSIAPTSNVSLGAPTRANEKGQCPTCYRQFGIKAYDRHVAWCKERITRAPSSPATNVAKERLDARMNYRAPGLKNRRMTNREKYAPGNFSMTNITNNNKHNSSPPSGGNKGMKDNSLPINGNKHMENPVIKPSAVAERRHGQGKGDGVIAPGPLKSRLSDRSIKYVDNNPDLTLPPVSSCTSLTQNNQYSLDDLSTRRNLDNDLTSTATSSQSRSSTRKSEVRSSRKLRKQKNFVITRSHGNPTVNDVAVNDNEIGIMSVKPYFYYNDNGLITWKQICDDRIKTKCDDRNNKKSDFINLNNIQRISNNQKLNRTYLINESIGIELDNSTKVINDSDDNLNLKLFLEKNINDLDEFPPTTLTEFNIDVTSTSTPVSFEANDSERKNTVFINKLINELEDESTIDIDDNSKKRYDTYVIEETVASFDLNNAQKMTEDVEQIKDEFPDVPNSIIHENVTKINLSSPSNKTHELSFKIPQINEEILLINDTIPINNIHMKSDAELSVGLSRDFTSDSLDSSRSNKVLMTKRLRKKMNLLRNSTDILISSIEANSDVATRRFKSNSHLELNSNDNDLNIETQRNINVSEYTMFPSILINQRDDKQCLLSGKDMPYWKRMMNTSRKKIINNFNLLKNSKVNPNSLPSLVSIDRRNDAQDTRLPWINYVRRHPDFNLVLTGRIGMSQDYDPFLIAERQLNELLSDTCSEQSFPDSTSSQYKNSKSSHYPLSPSSAFVKYPNPLSLDTVTEKRASLIAPPSEFDDLSIGFSSDSTETNSITRELYTELESSNCRRENNTNKNKDKQPILSRRLIIEKSKALGCTNDNFNVNSQCKNALKNKNHKTLNKISSNKVIRPQFTRSNSVRAASVSKNEEGIDSCYSHKMNSRSSSGSRFCNKNNNYGQNSGSNLSLNSIISSENDTKRSNFGLDELINSFDDDTISYPSLKSFLKNDSLSTSSPIQVNRNDNGQVNDDDLSSPDSYKRQDHSKISVDSAYSSLNRKYSNHGLISNDMANKRNEITPSRRSADNDITSTINKSKMSKFCHECGTKFPDTAKFCCECGVQRLAL